MADAPPALRLMLVDDHEVVRRGLRAILGAAPALEVVAEAGTVAEAVAVAARTAPDVVLMDVRLPDGSGVDATRAIRDRHPRTKVLMLTSFADDDVALAARAAGAAGFLLKHMTAEELAGAVRAVGQGRDLFDAPAGPRGTAGHRPRPMEDPRLARLSAQERQILGMIAAGLTNRQIAAHLDLAEKTVKNYVSGILGKLQVSRRSEAATYLIRHTTTFEH